MADAFLIRVLEHDRELAAVELRGSVELGRQKRPDEKLFAPFDYERDKPLPRIRRTRLVIAPPMQHGISREQVLVELLGPGRLRLTNLSDTQPIKLDHGPILKPGDATEAPLPSSMSLGSLQVRIQDPEDDGAEAQLQSLAEATLAPGRFGKADASMLSSLPLSGGREADMEQQLRWLQAILGVLQSAASSSDFFQQAARAAVELVGLDSGQVLLCRDGQWHPEASFPPTRLRPASTRVLKSVREQRRTFWQIRPPSGDSGGSLAGIMAVLAAPILSPKGEVLGALYGDRYAGGNIVTAMPLTKVKAMLMELLASGIAAGLARLEQEQAALAARVQFEQFFTPELARTLALQPDLLKGRDEEVSLLFCDLRAFSRHSEKLGPARTVEWVGGVLEELSECVLAQGGVLVDYIGDELIAMWGAPEVQPDHAERACLAAVAMIEKLPDLNTRWQSLLGESMGFGIGINTGIARVGNIGTARKFKYGPLGNTVNLASRVQGATKYLKVAVLATGATCQRLDHSFRTRRLGRVRVVHIAEPVELFELAPADQPGWENLRLGYERALEAFEKRQFRQVPRILGDVLDSYPDDGPSLILLARAVECLVHDPENFEAVWELPGK